MWRKLHLLLLVSAALLLLPACRPAPRADLVIVNGTEPESLDPAIVTGVSEMRITKALFEGLLRLDGRTGHPIPALAERFDVSPDGTSYTFHLRTNAQWSTGTLITAEDVVYSWRRALSPSTAADYAGQLFYIRNAEQFYAGTARPEELGVTAVGTHVVRVNLIHPLVFFPDLCCFPILAVVPRSVIEQLGDRWLSATPLPCSGPYALDSWRLNDKVRLRKNRFYYDASRTQSEVIDVLPVGSPNTALNLYETGLADVVWDKDLLPTELVDVLRNRPDWHTFDYLGTYFYRFNVTRKPFDDARVRRAFALATDKERLVRKLTSCGERPARHFVPAGVANYDSPEGLGFDPQAARQLLADAGYPAGKGFPQVRYSFFSAAGGGAKMQGKIAVELRDMWSEALGVTVELRQIERKVFYSAQSRLDFDMSASSWVGDYNDANTFLDLYLSASGNNRTGWKNPAYDSLIREANRQTNTTKRAALFKEAEHLLVADEVPVVPLYFYAGFNLFDTNRIHGIFPNILDEHPLQEISVTKQPGRN